MFTPAQRALLHDERVRERLEATHAAGGNLLLHARDRCGAGGTRSGDAPA